MTNLRVATIRSHAATIVFEPLPQVRRSLLSRRWSPCYRPALAVIPHPAVALLDPTRSRERLICYDYLLLLTCLTCCDVPA